MPKRTELEEAAIAYGAARARVDSQMLPENYTPTGTSEVLKAMEKPAAALLEAAVRFARAQKEPA